jgi:23S rRNA (cytosine1962-C5)-methyltransferase
METLTPQWASYELADSGDGKKLERFDEFMLIRPEAQARWKPALPAHRWEAAHGEFVKTSRGQQGEWKFRKPAPKRWTMQRKNLKFWVQPAPSGHVGVFPDQACHWDWIAEATRLAADAVELLCLFGHTGLAALAAAAAGARVTHVDASRKAVASARENQSLSGLGARPIRWIVEDALRFVRREARRGNQYNAMVLDPPRFGRGPDGEIWKFEDSLPELLGACASILSTRPVFALLNVYATVLTEGRMERDAEGLHAGLKAMLGESRIAVNAGALAIQDAAGRRISASVFARARSVK